MKYKFNVGDQVWIDTFGTKIPAEIVSKDELRTFVAHHKKEILYVPAYMVLTTCHLGKCLEAETNLIPYKEEDDDQKLI